MTSPPSGARPPAGHWRVDGTAAAETASVSPREAEGGPSAPLAPLLPALGVAAAPGLFAVFTAQLRRDLTISLRDRGDWMNALAFFGLVITLFPLAISPEPERLRELAPGALWVAALLAMLLALDGLFRRDYDDGSLEQFVLGSRPLLLGVLAKLLAFWLLTGLPLTLLSPLLGYALNLAPDGYLPLLCGLALGTPILTLLGGAGAALTVSLRRGGVLLALLVLPLTVPVLILGVTAVDLASHALPARPALLWLGALLLGGATFLPLAIVAALRLAVE